ncbi:MAG: type I-U CRISPR-associated protein Csb2 [Pseudonocardia sp.]|nr:type I-U CRISPR-associated protein Csb2 [Pseudonocardia sp.]
MPFSIRAELPLGTYRGNKPDRTPELLPSVSRLYAGLLCAAGFGPRAVAAGDGWKPCTADVAALRWLEDNPPTDVQIPQLQVSRNGAIAYRADGTIGKSGKAKVIRRLPKYDGVVAVDGPFVWTWRDAPPATVVDALRELCSDVTHLGTAESPVLLTVTDDDVAPTHQHAADSGPFDGAAGHDIEVPAPGRLDELATTHRAERSGRVGSDRAGTDERAASPVPPRRAVRTARYRRIAAVDDEVPWSQVLVVPLDRRVPERRRVRWAVAAHKALIKHLDRTAPPLLTGAYPEGTRRPPNRVALHVLDHNHQSRADISGSALAVLLPSAADTAELDAVYQAVGSLRSLTVGRGAAAVTARVAGQIEVHDGSRFWREPEPGQVRLWTTEPAAVPDTRGHEGWTFVHAALLSVGFVWQGMGLDRPPGRGAARDETIIETVNAAGVVVVDAAPVRGGRVDDYVHRVHPHAVVRPYTATLSLGDLGGPATVQAIGQCRHLGGGLLVPRDFDEGTVIGRGRSE